MTRTRLTKTSWVVSGFLALFVISYCIVHALEIQTPAASRHEFKTPSPGTSVDGTEIDWGNYGTGKDMILSVDKDRQILMESDRFLYTGNSTSTSDKILAVHATDSTANGYLFQLMSGSSSTPRFTVFRDGRSQISASPTTTYSDMLYVDGISRFTDGLRFDSSASSMPSEAVIRHGGDSSPPTTNVLDGDLYFDTDAHPFYGLSSGGGGGWVVYDSTSSSWKVLHNY